MLQTADRKEFELTRQVFHSNLGIIGRGTVAVRATLKGGPPDKIYAIKISWPEESRPNEAEILRAAMEKAGHDRDITDHFPRVFATQDFPFRTGTACTALGSQLSLELSEKRSASRGTNRNRSLYDRGLTVPRKLGRELTLSLSSRP